MKVFRSYLVHTSPVRGCFSFYKTAGVRRSSKTPSFKNFALYYLTAWKVLVLSILAIFASRMLKSWSMYFLIPLMSVFISSYFQFVRWNGSSFGIKKAKWWFGFLLIVLTNAPSLALICSTLFDFTSVWIASESLPYFYTARSNYSCSDYVQKWLAAKSCFYPRQNISLFLM